MPTQANLGERDLQANNGRVSVDVYWRNRPPPPPKLFSGVLGNGILKLSIRYGKCFRQYRVGKAYSFFPPRGTVNDCLGIVSIIGVRSFTPRHGNGTGNISSVIASVTGIRFSFLTVR